MQKTVVGLATILATTLAMASALPALAQSEPDGFQENEMPGSEIKIDIGEGGTNIEREDGKPLLGGGTLGEDEPALYPLDDPDEPVSPDAIDAELPGEGPESLSGPDDDDPLPY